MSLNFKSFIKNKSLFLIIIPSIILILGMVFYFAEEKVIRKQKQLENEKSI